MSTLEYMCLFLAAYIFGAFVLTVIMVVFIKNIEKAPPMLGFCIGTWPISIPVLLILLSAVFTGNFIKSLREKLIT